MQESHDIKERTDELAKILDRVASGHDQLCGSIISGGAAAGTYPGLADLEHVRTEAETLKRELAAIKIRGKLDPEVRQLENELDEVLRRYYLLWQKCKTNLPEQ